MNTLCTMFRFKGIVQWWALVLLLGLLLSGCGFDRIFLDESNLEKVINYYYAFGKEKGISPESKYHFLSMKSKERMTLEDWKRLTSDDLQSNFVTELKVLKVDESLGNKYAIVSTTESFPATISGQEYKKFKDLFGLKVTNTFTWVEEDGKWRRLIFTNMQQEAEKIFKNGDYSGAEEKYEEWLKLDPYCVQAYSGLIDSYSRRGNQGSNQMSRTPDDIIRALLSINPNDTAVLFSAATYSENLSVSKTYLKMLEGTVQYSNAAFNIGNSIKSPADRLSFLNGLKLDSGLVMMKLATLGELGKWAELKDLSNGLGSFSNIKSYLEDNDSSYAAYWCAILGANYLDSKDKDMAQKYLNYGILRDPNNPGLKILANYLNK